ncbi:MAG: hypothetical protein ABR500_05815 [Dermatophilaceae bacterium]|nr:hypothetical protein [Intrasporangiaceae bacterium]
MLYVSSVRAESNPGAGQGNAWVAISLIGILSILGGPIAGLASLAAVIYIAVTVNSDTVTRRGWHDQFGGTRVVRTA